MNRSNWKTNRRTLFLTFIILFVILGCNLPASTPTPDLFATLQAATPLTLSTAAPILTPDPDHPTAIAIPPTALSGGPIPAPLSTDGLTGHIVFTCQMFKAQYAEQVCIMNADGTGFRRLTAEDGVRHFYPSLAPDGKSVLYSGFRETNIYEIYEYNLADGSVDILTNKLGIATAPEVSPDGKSVVFMRWTDASNQYQVWLMNRNGDNARRVPKIIGWDPTWSPSGEQILFASTDTDGRNQLFAVNKDGSNQYKISDLPSIRGRNDWSPDGSSIVTYSGEPWHREVYIMDADGSDTRQLTPTGGNSQGPSFSPDGKWVVFTAYFDKYGDDHGCEIYVIRTDGTDLRRLTDNDYCDYQPRWGL